MLVQEEAMHVRRLFACGWQFELKRPGATRRQLPQLPPLTQAACPIARIAGVRPAGVGAVALIAARGVDAGRRHVSTDAVRCMNELRVALVDICICRGRKARKHKRVQGG